MRAVFLASTLRLGGAERITGDITRRLNGHGIEVTWALLREKGPEGERLAAAGLPVHGDLAPAITDAVFPRRLTRLIRETAAEALYALDHQNAAVAAALGARAAPRRYLAVHTTGLWGGRPSLPRGTRWALRRFTRVVAVAEGQARYLESVEGVPAERLVVIRNGIDVAQFTETPERAAAGRTLRADILDGAGGPLFGIVAALRPEKAHPFLFEAFARVRAAQAGARLVLIGDGPERGALEALASRPPLAGAVRFLGARDDVADLLQAVDVVVLPSHPSVETLPLSLIEAMAAGRPVVATRVGSVDELVADGVTGTLVPPRDVPSLAGALLRLAGDRSLRESYGRKGVERARGFDIETTVARTAALLRGELD